MLDEWLAAAGIALAERGIVPDIVLRAAIRRLCQSQLDSLDSGSEAENERRLQAFVADAKRGPIALATDEANQQHYEVDARFYQLVLGPRRKYSSCLWADDAHSLADAEAAALRQTCEHAEIVNGQRILELGCGWGSLTLWLLEHYPHCRVTAVSNSQSQRDLIQAEAQHCGWADRLTVITADMNRLTLDEQFDRVVSVEMFEHMRNYAALLKRVREWLLPDGKLLVHIFCHRRFAYPFRTDRPSDWMGRNFFTGGMMPSLDWLARFADDLIVERTWQWNGQHYARTLAAWDQNLCRQRSLAVPLLGEIYGQRQANRWFHRWRMFFLAAEELFAFRAGQEWFVAHYLLRPAG